MLSYCYLHDAFYPVLLNIFLHHLLDLIPLDFPFHRASRKLVSVESIIAQISQFAYSLRKLPQKGRAPAWPGPLPWTGLPPLLPAEGRPRALFFAGSAFRLPPGDGHGGQLLVSLQLGGVLRRGEHQARALVDRGHGGAFGQGPLRKGVVFVIRGGLEASGWSGPAVSFHRILSEVLALSFPLSRRSIHKGRIPPPGRGSPSQPVPPSCGSCPAKGPRGASPHKAVPQGLWGKAHIAPLPPGSLPGPDRLHRRAEDHQAQGDAPQKRGHLLQGRAVIIILQHYGKPGLPIAPRSLGRQPEAEVQLPQRLFGGRVGHLFRPVTIMRRNRSPRRWTHRGSAWAKAWAVVDFPEAITPVIR